MNANQMQLALTIARSVTDPKFALEFESDSFNFTFDNLPEPEQRQCMDMAVFLTERYKQSDLSASVIYLAWRYARPNDDNWLAQYSNVTPLWKQFFNALAAAVLAVEILG